MPDEPAKRRRPSNLRLEEIFGSELGPKPDGDADTSDERRAREEEYIENRPPHHGER